MCQPQTQPSTGLSGLACSRFDAYVTMGEAHRQPSLLEYHGVVEAKSAVHRQEVALEIGSVDMGLAACLIALAGAVSSRYGGGVRHSGGG
jgi:hypothetical protein